MPEENDDHIYIPEWGRAIEVTPYQTIHHLGTCLEEEEAPKDKNGKPDWTIFPFQEACEVLKVFEYGAKKYGTSFTYRRGGGVPKLDLVASMLRHCLSLLDGEEVDKESGCLHAAHAAANCLMWITTHQKENVF
jgi:hypothetical protein